MLQFIIKSDSAEEIRRQFSEAIEGGCRWIELYTSADISDDRLKPLAEELAGEAHSKEAVFMLANRVTLSKLAGCDGVQLYDKEISASAARTELDASPIIGITVDCFETIELRHHLDVDYFRFEPVFDGNRNNLALLAEIAEKAAENDVEKPLAAGGGINFDNYSDVLAAGAVGIAVDSSIARSEEKLSAAVAHMIKLIGRD